MVADITLVQIDYPAQVVRGQSFDFTALIKNTGDVAFDATLRFLSYNINGQPGINYEGSKVSNVQPGATVQVLVHIPAMPNTMPGSDHMSGILYEKGYATETNSLITQKNSNISALNGDIYLAPWFHIDTRPPTFNAYADVGSAQTVNVKLTNWGLDEKAWIHLYNFDTNQELDYVEYDQAAISQQYSQDLKYTMPNAEQVRMVINTGSFDQFGQRTFQDQVTFTVNKAYPHGTFTAEPVFSKQYFNPGEVGKLDVKVINDGTTDSQFTIKISDFVGNVVNYTAVTINPGQTIDLPFDFTMSSNGYDFPVKVTIFNETTRKQDAEIIMTAPTTIAQLTVLTDPAGTSDITLLDQFGQIASQVHNAPLQVRVLPGQYTARFGFGKDVVTPNGLITPADQAISLVEHDNQTFTGTYEKAAQLIVKTVPVPAVIFIDNTPTGVGQISAWKLPGTYLVSFGPAQGYTQPGSINVTLTQGESKTIEGNYTTGSTSETTGGRPDLGVLLATGALILAALLKR